MQTQQEDAEEISAAVDAVAAFVASFNGSQFAGIDGNHISNARVGRKVMRRG